MPRLELNVARMLYSQTVTYTRFSFVVGSCDRSTFGLGRETVAVKTSQDNLNIVLKQNAAVSAAVCGHALWS